MGDMIIVVSSSTKIKEAFIKTKLDFKLMKV